MSSDTWYAIFSIGLPVLPLVVLVVWLGVVEGHFVDLCEPLRGVWRLVVQRPTPDASTPQRGIEIQ